MKETNKTVEELRNEIERIEKEQDILTRNSYLTKEALRNEMELPEGKRDKDKMDILMATIVNFRKLNNKLFKESNRVYRALNEAKGAN